MKQIRFHRVVLSWGLAFVGFVMDGPAAEIPDSVVFYDSPTNAMQKVAFEEKPSDDWDENHLRKQHWERMCSSSVASATVDLLVVDYDGIPIPDADVEMSWAKSCGWGWNDKPKYEMQTGKTDSGGLFSSTGKTYFGVKVKVRKKGYYPARVQLPFQAYGNEIGYQKKEWFSDHVRFRLRLCKIKEPVALRAFSTSPNALLCKLNEDVGFDVAANDFVAPYGKGTQFDFVFRIEASSIDSKDTHFVWKAPEGGVQILPTNPYSGFPYVQEAPEDGYEHQAVFSRDPRPLATIACSMPKDRFLVFWAKDSTGRILYGYCEYLVFGGSRISMNLRINDKGSRNLESKIFHDELLERGEIQLE